jgi:hypothetical protein
LDQVPTISCFHGSCKDQVEATNKDLRRALAGAGPELERKKLTAEEKQRIQEHTRKEHVRKRAANSKAAILKQYRWPYAQICQDSAVKLQDNVAEHWRLLLGCFGSDDVVWIGGTYDSGKPEAQAHFLSAQEWLKKTTPPGQYICASTFEPGSYSRTNDNVVARRFLVVESDVLGRDEVGAIFRWMQDAVGLKLRAIVDTAGKSLHAWFDYPAEPVLEDLKLVLPELGCDPKLFTPSQPVRLPSALREKKHQKLIYLSKEVAS